MAHYHWEIKTGDARGSGTDANIFMTARGDKGTMQELELRDRDDPDSNNWEQSEVNHGAFETADLGNLMTGTLRQDGWGAFSDWTPVYVKITNDDDGRVWIAPVGKELKTNEVFRLVFKLEDAGSYEQQQQAKKDAERRAKDEQDAKQAAEDEARADREAEEADRKARKEIEAQRRQVELELKRAKQQAELAKAKAELEKLKNPAPSDNMPTGFRTVELFGQLNGRNVPLSEVLSSDGQRYSVVPGGQVLGGESAGEGFGYGGAPGRWAEASGGQPPTAYGQDANLGIVGFDGARAWPVPSSTLEQIFGNWRGALS